MATGRALGLVRHFSTSTAKAGLVKTPIQIFGPSGRYASALYSAAVKQKQLESVEKEIKSIQDLMKKDTKFTDFMLNPSVKRVTKRDVVSKALKGQKYSDITVNLFAAMAENGRLPIVKNVIVDFERLMSAHRGDVVCTITTAKPLTDAQMKELQTVLQMFIQKGQNLQLNAEVDASIIGGMVVKIGDKFVDMSMSRKIQTYSNLIKQAI